MRWPPWARVSASVPDVAEGWRDCHKKAGIGAPDGPCTDRKADRDPVIVHAGRVYHAACPADMMT
ncbi:hypothetical protein GCM10023157_01810 [Gluconacetobacter asukensis]